MSLASAPGKIILFGEHAVVYGRPALAVPVTQLTTDVETDRPIETNFRGKDWREAVFIEAPGIRLSSTLAGLLARRRPDPLATVILGALQAAGVDSLPPTTIRITSSIPVASGFGSGAAVSVALIRAISSAVHRPLSDEQVNALAYEAEKLHHGTPSGIDNTVITYARPVYFVKGQPIETFHAGKPFTIVIGYSGVAASTRESVGDVRKLWEADAARWESVFDRVGEIVKAARQKIEAGDADALGPLMDANHALLQEMTVSSPELDRLVAAARSAGALGAKLSGGGRGGNMIALIPPAAREPVEASLRAAGAQRVLVTTVE
jgi:mevalonate kinase